MKITGQFKVAAINPPTGDFKNFNLRLGDNDSGGEFSAMVDFVPAVLKEGDIIKLEADLNVRRGGKGVYLVMKDIRLLASYKLVEIKPA